MVVKTMKLVLASASPRRRQLLSGLGVPFEVSPSLNPEDDVTGTAATDPGGLAVELACRKAEDVATRLTADHRPAAVNSGREEAVLVIGADTVVVVAGRLFGKPASAHEAEEMLKALSGREHRVVTGVVVIDAVSRRRAAAAEETRVRFRRLSQAEIQAYVASGEPLDKAGAYAVQGLGALLVERIEGCYFNVVGLPLVRLAALLAEFGYDLFGEAARCAVRSGPASAPTGG